MINNNENQIHPVSREKEGSKVFINRLEGGWEFRKKLSALGFIKGAEIKILKNAGSGPILVRVNHSRVALGRGEAEKISVTDRMVEHDNS